MNYAYCSGQRPAARFEPDGFMFRRQHKEEQLRSTYATYVDFCQIFQEEMKALYLLALLLSANHKQAEACFTQSLENCFNGPPVFAEWAKTWARRMVIINAIRLCLRRQLDVQASVNAADGGSPTSPEIAAVLSLPAFERFIFVISVLERYSDQECSLLLDRGRREVHLARIRALEQITSQLRFDRTVDVNCAYGNGQVGDSTAFVSLLTGKI
jgi:DNA-directed RNA polymerase specialized sigma24 family protein